MTSHLHFPDTAEGDEEQDQGEDDKCAGYDGDVHIKCSVTRISNINRIN